MVQKKKSCISCMVLHHLSANKGCRMIPRLACEIEVWCWNNVKSLAQATLLHCVLRVSCCGKSQWEITEIHSLLCFENTKG